MTVNYKIRPYLKTSEHKYSYDDWKRKQLALGRITLSEFLNDMCNSGKPMANLYLEKCPVRWKKVYYKENIKKT